MLERMWINGNPLTLLMGLQADTTTMENSVEIKKKKKKTKLGIKLPFNPAIPLYHYWAFTLENQN